MKIPGSCILSTVDAHGPIYVQQTSSHRVLSFDGKTIQSSMRLSSPNGLELSYTQAMMTGLLYIPEPKTATVLGLGAGSMVKCLLSSFPQLAVHAVEYRAAVVEIAISHFQLPDSNRLNIHVDDALNYIENPPIQSDIIFADLFNAEGLEALQVQTCYLRDCFKALTAHGVLVLNIALSTAELREQLHELLALEFENKLLRLEVDTGNTIVLAFKSAPPSLSTEELQAKAHWLQDKIKTAMLAYAKALADF